MSYLSERFKFVKFRDILSIFGLILMFIPAMIAKIFIRDFWLICEDRNEARDNGYWLFKYIRENHKEQKVAYAINKKSVDYQKVKNLGKVIQFGSLSHWFWYLVADKNISSQKNGKPNAAVCYVFEVVLGFRKKNRYFLQHGIVMNNLEFLHYKNSKIYRFFTTTKDEYNYVVEKFGYKQNQVVLAGLSRFDSLTNENMNPKQILIMPSWRNWIAREVECEKYEGTKVFEETEYYKTWNSFLNNERFAKFLEKNNLIAVFYPHRNMQKYIDLFKTGSKNIVIANTKLYDVQTLINNSACMITDYSSVLFDFAYLGKPVIFYQFDEEKFRHAQYEKGYFDYKSTVLGTWTDSADGVLDILEKEKKNFDKPNQEKMKQCFMFVDKNNNKRIYEEIKNANKKQNQIFG